MHTQYTEIKYFKPLTKASKSYRKETELESEFPVSLTPY